MKRYLRILLIICTFFLPFSVWAKTPNVTISKVELESKNETVIVNKDPIIKDLQLDLDISFTEIGDKIVYKLTIENKDNEDFILSSNKFGMSDYLDYNFTFADNNNVIKSNSKKIMYISMKYSQAVPQEVLVDGKFIESKKLQISLMDDNGKVINPSTGYSTLLVIVVLIALFITGFSIYQKEINFKYTPMIIILGVMLLPIGIYAYNEITLTINDKVTIMPNSKIEFCVDKIDIFNNASNNSKSLLVPDSYKYYSYTPGMTLRQFFTNNNLPMNRDIEFDTYEALECIYANNYNYDECVGVNKGLSYDSKIIGKDQGCYFFYISDK